MELFDLCRALHRAAKTDIYDKRWQKIPDADKNDLVVAAVHLTATGVLTLQASGILEMWGDMMRLREPLMPARYSSDGQLLYEVDLREPVMKPMDTSA